MLAFVVSLDTTTVSYYHTEQQDVHSLRGELRGMLQRLSALPRESVETNLQYKNDPSSLLSISGFINQENLMLAVQADDILQRLPAEQISAIDFITVGQALMNSRRFDSAIIDLQKASKVAAGLDDDVGARRILAALEMAKGQAGPSRQTFQDALDIFAKYPGFDDFNRRTTTAPTQLLWAGAEAGIREFGNARQHLAQAQDVVSGMPPGPVGDVWRIQVQTFRQQLDQAQTNPAMTSPLPGQSLPTLTSAGVATPPQ